MAQILFATEARNMPSTLFTGVTQCMPETIEWKFSTVAGRHDAAAGHWIDGTLPQRSAVTTLQQTDGPTRRILSGVLTPHCAHDHAAGMTSLKLRDHAKRVAVFIAAERLGQPFARFRPAQRECRLRPYPDRVANGCVVLRDGV